MPIPDPVVTPPTPGAPAKKQKKQERNVAEITMSIRELIDGTFAVRVGGNSDGEQEAWSGSAETKEAARTKGQKALMDMLNSLGGAKPE